MSKYVNLAWLVLALMTVGAAAQTVTGSGTSGTIPVFTGGSTVGNSVLTQSNGNVSITETNNGQGTGWFSSPTGIYLGDDLYNYGPGIIFGIPPGDVNGEYAAIGVEPSPGWWLNTDYAGDFDIATQAPRINLSSNFADAQLSIISNGNVGIGTMAPSYKLDVSGAIHSSSGGFVFPDGTTQTTAYTAAASTLDSLFTQSNGSIGIGTVVPAAILGMSPTFTGISGSATQGIDVAANANPASTSSLKYFGAVLTASSLSGNSQTFTQGFTGSSGQAYHKGTGTVAWEVGADGEIYNLSTGTISLARGGQGFVVNSSSGNIPIAQGIYSQIENTGSGTISNGYGFYVDAPVNSGGGALTNYYGLYLATPTAGSTNYSLYSSGGTNYFGGYVGIGTTNPAQKLEVNGYIQTDAGIYFPGNSTPQTQPYTGTTCGGDYAESMDVIGDHTKYAPGDVLVLDTDNPGKILESIEPYSTAVAGIYSTKPGTVGRRQLTPKSDTEVPMAMVGVVPTKVSAENGPIKVGDLLVSSSKPGYAMKGTDRSRMLGAVIGKAMGPLESGAGTIEVLVTLQ